MLIHTWIFASHTVPSKFIMFTGLQGQGGGLPAPLVLPNSLPGSLAQPYAQPSVSCAPYAYHIVVPLQVALPAPANAQQPLLQAPAALPARTPQEVTMAAQLLSHAVGGASCLCSRLDLLLCCYEQQVHAALSAAASQQVSQPLAEAAAQAPANPAAQPAPVALPPQLQPLEPEAAAAPLVLAAAKAQPPTALISLADATASEVPPDTPKTVPSPGAAGECSERQPSEPVRHLAKAKAAERDRSRSAERREQRRRCSGHGRSRDRSRSRNRSDSRSRGRLRSGSHERGRHRGSRHRSRSDSPCARYLERLGSTEVQNCPFALTGPVIMHVYRHCKGVSPPLQVAFTA